MADKKLADTDPCVGNIVSNSHVTVLTKGAGLPDDGSSITHLDLRQKAYQFQPTTSLAAPVGTKKGATIGILGIGNSMSSYMEVWKNNHTYIYGGYDIKIINTANMGMSGSIMVGLGAGVSPYTEDDLNDNDRQIMDISQKGEYQVHIEPMRDAVTPTTGRLAGALCTAMGPHYPNVVLLAFEDFQSTFDNQKLICQFHVYCRWSPGTKFTLMGPVIPPAKPGSGSFTQFTSMSQILGSDTAQFVLDGNFGETSVRQEYKDNVHFGGIVNRPIIDKFTDTNAGGDHRLVDGGMDPFPGTLPTTYDSTDTISFNCKQGPTKAILHYSANVRQPDDAFFYLPKTIELGDMYLEDINYTIPDQHACMVLPECRIVINYTVPTKSTVDYAEAMFVNAFRAMQMSADEAIVGDSGLMAMCGSNNFPHANYSANVYCKATINRLGQIVSLSTNAGQGLTIRYWPLVNCFFMATTDGSSLNNIQQTARVLWMSTVQMKIDTSSIEPILADPLEHVGLISLPNDCMRLICSEKIVPSVNNTSGALPTIIQDVDLPEKLSRFFDPENVWDLRIVDTTFRQPICDIIFHGPQKLCFVKTVSSNRYYVNKFTSKDLLIASANVLASGSTYPATSLDRTWLSRVGSEYVKSLTPIAKVKLEDVVEYQGAAASVLGGGALQGVGSGLSQMASNNFAESMFDKTSGLSKELRALIGEQAMDQLLTSLQGQQDLARLNSELTMQRKGIITPAMQEQLARGETLPSGDILPSARTDRPDIDPLTDLNTGADMTSHTTPALWDYEETQNDLNGLNLHPTDAMYPNSQKTLPPSGINSDPAKVALLNALDAAARSSTSQSRQSPTGAIPKTNEFFKSGNNIINDMAFRNATRDSTERTKMENRNGGYHANSDNHAEIFANLSPVQQRMMAKQSLLPPKESLMKFDSASPYFDDDDEILQPKPIPFTPIPERKFDFSSDLKLPTTFQMKKKSPMDYLPSYDLSDSDEDASSA